MNEEEENIILEGGEEPEVIEEPEIVEEEETIEEKKVVKEKPVEKKPLEETKKKKPGGPIVGMPKTFETGLMGKYMLRDMPLFKFEMVALFGLVFTAMIVYYLDYKGITENFARIFMIVAIALPLGIWMFKWMNYMPRKNRIPGMKIYKSGIIELGVYDISKGYIPFGRGEEMHRKYIAKVNKHIEASTGRPFIAVSELEGQNLNLLRTDKPDMRSEEFDAILEMNTAVTTKNVMKRMLRFTAPTLSNPVMILQIMSMGIMVVLLLLQMGIFG